MAEHVVAAKGLGIMTTTSPRIIMSSFVAQGLERTDHHVVVLPLPCSLQRQELPFVALTRLICDVCMVRAITAWSRSGSKSKMTR